MLTYANQNRLLYGLALVILVVFIIIGAGIILVLIRDYQSADYPGAQVISDHSIYIPFPLPHIRRDTAYRIVDDFPTVYNWYSQRFRLGPERQAQSRCIHMFGSTASSVSKRDTSVTVCDTPNGRMVFVQRSMFLRFRR